MQTTTLSKYFPLLPSSSRIAAGRPDGFGMVFCNFLYYCYIARIKKKDLVIYWPIKISHQSKSSKFALDQLFSSYCRNFRLENNRYKVCLLKKQYCDEDVFLQNLAILRDEYKCCREHPYIQNLINSLPSYDFGIHARLGDVVNSPFIQGGPFGRYIPLSAYKIIIHKLVSDNPCVKIFLASNSTECLNLKATYPDNIETESDLFSNYSSINPNSLLGSWLVIRQLSKVSNIISPYKSAFSLLARVVSPATLHHSTPSQFLNLDELVSELHHDYYSAAQRLFGSPRFAASDSFRYALAGRWRRVPFHHRLDVCSKILLS